LFQSLCTFTRLVRAAVHDPLVDLAAALDARELAGVLGGLLEGDAETLGGASEGLQAGGDTLLQ